jgi:hypothetical protein
MRDVAKHRLSSVSNTKLADRRHFLKSSAAMIGALGLVGKALGSASRNRDPFVGIQIAAHSFLDEGIDHCLDLLRQNAMVTAPLVSCYGYYGAMGRPLHLMADHGVPKRDNSKRQLPVVWVRHQDKYFTETKLHHPQPAPDCEYADRDVFHELAEPIRKRGMKLYVRIYEPSSDALKYIANWDRVRQVDCAGKKQSKPCLNHPEFRAWTAGTVADLFTNYPLDGIQYGAERSGPLGNLLHWNSRPYCFCEFCIAKAKDEGIDAERARRGMNALYEYTQALRSGKENASDGVLVEFLRIIMRYPEVLAWERQWHIANDEVHQVIYDTVKDIRAGAEVGRHVAHVESSMDIFYRVAAPYGEMADSCDFVKPILYHEIAGPRFNNWYINQLGKTILRELDDQQSLKLFYAIFGHDPKNQPTLDQLDERGFTPEYVYRETKRCVDAVKGKARVYSGIGLDIPKGGGWGNEFWHSDPESVYEAVCRSFDAGAAGIVISREYEENSLPSLKAVGRAVRERFAG